MEGSGAGSRSVQIITDPDPTKNLRVLQILIQIYDSATVYVFLGFFHDAIQTQRSLNVFASEM